MLPLISVIVPNYNHEKYLVQRLESILNQTYPNFEVILLDDRSTDNSRTILNQYASNSKVSHCVFNDVNTGNTFVQWNTGIHLAKGDFIWIAESDDFCDSNFIENVIKPLLENPDVVLSYCQSHRVNEKGEITGNWISHTETLNAEYFSKNELSDGNYFIENFLIFKNVIPNASAVIFRKEASFVCDFLEIDRDLRYCGDWIFYFKIILNNKIAFVSKSYNSFRYHKNSVIATALKNENRIRIIDIDFVMRAQQIDFLKKNKPSNYLNIISNNTKIIRNLKYEKALLLLNKKQYVTGFLLLISVVDIFIVKYKHRNFLKKKLKRTINLKS
jgi:glycosyltransferase involved in cell wall biosynthesis